MLAKFLHSGAHLKNLAHYWGVWIPRKAFGRVEARVCSVHVEKNLIDALGTCQRAARSAVTHIATIGQLLWCAGLAY